VLLLIVAQNSLHVLTTRYSRLPGQPPYNAGAMVLCYELTKLVFCVLMVLATQPAPSQHIWQKVVTEWDITLKVALPALLYVVQNTLLFVAIAELPAPIFMVLYQFKLFVIALFSMLLLGRTFSRTQWASLGVLVVGLATVQVGSSATSSAGPSDDDGDGKGLSAIGLAAVGACCILSAFCGVWFEKMLKAQGAAKASLWVRNIQLSLVGGYAATFDTICDHLAICRAFLSSAPDPTRAVCRVPCAVCSTSRPCLIGC